MQSLNTDATGRWEPVLTATFLPRCGQCHGAHPQARNPPSASQACPGCGAKVAAPGAPMTVKAVLSGLSPSALIARAFFAVAQFLDHLAKGL